MLSIMGRKELKNILNCGKGVFLCAKPGIACELHCERGGII